MADTDSTLIDRWMRRRDPDAMTEVVARYGPMVYAVCLRILRNAAHAEEVVQDCFVELLRTRAKLRTSLGGWLHAIAVSRAIDRLRAENARARRESAFAQSASTISHPTWDDLTDYLDEAIQELPEEIRAVIVQRYLCGTTYHATAAKLGVAVSTVQSRANKGLELLRDAFRKRGIMLSITGLAALFDSAPSVAMPAALTMKLGKLALSAAMASPATQAGMLASAWSMLASSKSLVVAATLASVAAGLIWMTYERRTANPNTGPSVQIAANANRSQQQKSPTSPSSSMSSVADKTAEAAPPPPATGSISGWLRDSEGNRRANWQVFANEARPDPWQGTPTIFQAGKPGGYAILGEEIGLYRGATQIPTARILRSREEAQRPRKTSEPVRSGSWSRMTNEDGTFTIRDLDAGTYVIEARNSYSWDARVQSAPIQLDAGQHVEGIELIWQTRASVRGWVGDIANTPLFRASVTARWKSVDANDPGIARSSTDSTGRFIIEGIPENVTGILRLRAQQYGFIPREIDATITGDDYVISLERMPLIEGRVVDARTRKPITKFQVTPITEVDRKSGNLNSLLRSRWIHDELGAFVIESWKANYFSLVISATGYRTAVLPFDLLHDEQQAAPLEIALQAPQKISGVVTDPLGNPVYGASLRWGDSVEDVAVSGIDGSFNVPVTGFEHDVLTVYHAVYAMAWVPIDVDAIPASPLHIILGKGAYVDGRVTMNGEPWTPELGRPDVWIELPGNCRFSVQSMGDGSFSTERLDAGVHTVCVGHMTGNSTQVFKQDIVVEDGSTSNPVIDVQVGDAIIEGAIVVDGLPPLEGVVMAHASLSDGTKVIVRSNVDADGVYRFSGLVPATYAIDDSCVLTPYGDVVTLDSVSITVNSGEIVAQNFEITQ